MKIIVDGLGGDKAPHNVKEGCKKALELDKELTLAIVGPRDEFSTYLADYKDRVEIIDTSEAVTNDDHPAGFLKAKPDSSLALAFSNLKERDDIDALLSAGPTGALLAGSIFTIGRLEGVKRPALIASLPTKIEGKYVRVCDVGANADCKPEYLAQFALMGEAYLTVLGIESPKVGLLNIGVEETKGNDISKEAFTLLKELNINFVGNAEADKVLTGEFDLVIADGFTGNIFLKATEGGVYMTAGLFKGALKKNILTKFGALLQKKGLKHVSNLISSASTSCAPLLGVSKLVFKVHGKEGGDTFATALLEVSRLVKEGLLDKIKTALN